MDFSSIVLVGFGYTGRYLLEQLQDSAVPVYGLSRQKAEESGAMSHFGYDLDSGEALPDLEWEGAGVIYMAPPNSEGGEDIRARMFLKQLEQMGNPRSVVYFSTTGVYGDCGGGWVSEESELRLGSERTRARASAEGQFGDYCKERGVRLKILRVGGIYGRGRLAIERLQKRIPVVLESEAPYINRIHVEDLAAIALKALEDEGVYRIYNVCDGDPRVSTDYYRILAEKTGLPEPVEVPLVEVLEGASPMMREFMTSSKRVDNKRILEELGVELRYKTIIEGISASL